MARKINKNNSLHHQDLGPIVIFWHHQEQHLKQPCLTSQEHKFSLCCNRHHYEALRTKYGS